MWCTYCMISLLLEPSIFFYISCDRVMSSLTLTLSSKNRKMKINPMIMRIRKQKKAKSTFCNLDIKPISFIHLTSLYLLFFSTLLSVLIQVIVISYLLSFLNDILDISIKILDYLAIIILQLYHHCSTRLEYKVGIQSRVYKIVTTFKRPHFILLDIF